MILPKNVYLSPGSTVNIYALLCSTLQGISIVGIYHAQTRSHFSGKCQARKHGITLTDS